MKVNVRTMAKEMMEQTKNSILAQAAQAMLAKQTNYRKEFYNFFVNLVKKRGPGTYGRVFYF